MIRYLCERCGDGIDPGERTLLVAVCGPGLNGRVRLDLCPGCLRSLARWAWPGGRNQAQIASDLVRFDIEDEAFRCRDRRERERCGAGGAA